MLLCAAALHLAVAAPPAVLNGTDLKGHDIGDLPLRHGTSWAEGTSACAAACAKARGCGGWVFVASPQLAGPRCVLKAKGACRPIPRPGCSAGLLAPSCGGDGPAPPPPPPRPRPRFQCGFHAQVEAGASADTNGPVYVNGWYHLFAQYRPGASRDGMEWFHWISRDLLGWTALVSVPVHDMYLDGRSQPSNHAVV